MAFGVALLLWSLACCGCGYCLNVHTDAGILAGKASRPYELSVAIANALSNIFQHTFARQNVTVYIKTNANTLTLTRRLLVQDVLEHLLVPRSTIVPTVLDAHLTVPAVVMRVDVHLLFVESMEHVLQETLAKIRCRYLIVLLHVAPKQTLLNLMSQIFAYFYQRHYIIDVSVLLGDTDACVNCELGLYTFYPYRPRQCASTRPVLLKHITGSQQLVSYSELYPMKLNNFYGCPLRVVVWHIPPYVEINWQAKSNKERIQGLDADILKTVASKLNFELQLQANEPPEYLGGQIFENGTMNGAYRMVYERRANLTLGCSACTPARTKFLTPTLPYFQMQYVIVLKSAQRYTALEVMLFPFDICTWLLAACLGLSRPLFQQLLYWVSRWRGLGVNAARANTGIDSTLYTHLLKGLCRLVCCVWLLLFFVLRISYEGSIFEFVHNTPMKPLPLTLDQLVAAGYKIITDHATYRMTETLPRLQAITQIVPGQPMDVFDALHAFPQLTGAFSSKAFLAYHLTKQRQKRDNYRILQEAVVDNMICIYFTRNSYVANVVNVQLLNMRGFGIFNHFSKRFSYANLPPTTGANRRSGGSGRGSGSGSGSGSEAAGGFRAECLQLVLAVLFCMLAMYVLSIAVFGLECLSRRCHTLTAIMRNL